MTFWRAAQLSQVSGLLRVIAGAVAPTAELPPPLPPLSPDYLADWLNLHVTALKETKPGNAR